MGQKISPRRRASESAFCRDGENRIATDSRINSLDSPSQSESATRRSIISRMRSNAGCANWPNPTTPYKASGFRTDQPSTGHPRRRQRASRLRRRAIRALPLRAKRCLQVSLLLFSATPPLIAISLFPLFCPYMWSLNSSKGKGVNEGGHRTYGDCEKCRRKSLPCLGF